jgi:hypothetical protein
VSMSENGTPILPDTMGSRELSVSGELFGERAPLYMRFDVAEGSIPETHYSFHVEASMNVGVLIFRLRDGMREVRTMTIGMSELAEAAVIAMRADYEYDPSEIPAPPTD